MLEGCLCNSSAQICIQVGNVPPLQIHTENNDRLIWTDLFFSLKLTVQFQALWQCSSGVSVCAHGNVSLVESVPAGHVQ